MHPIKYILATSLIALTAGCIDDCAEFDADGFCVDARRDVLPTYMTLATLRNSALVSSAVDIDPSTSELMLGATLGEHVYLIDHGQGVHVIDFTDSGAPSNVAYLHIPGVSETHISGNALYADSFVDLLIFDITNPNAITLAKRVQNALPWDAYHAMPNDVTLDEGDVDQQRGVIVGFIEK